MRHKQSTKKLNRNLGHRKALIRNLLIQLYTKENIVTTYAKAKAIKPIAEKLITKAKQNTIHNQRQLNSILNHRPTVSKLVNQIAPSYQQKTSGFIKTTKLSNRKGDNSLIAKIQLIKQPNISTKKNNDDTDKTQKTTKTKQQTEPVKKTSKPVKKSKSTQKTTKTKTT